MRRNKGFCEISNTGILVIVILALLCMLALPVVAQATVLRVDGANGNDSNDGSDWTNNAFQTIGAAITAAAQGDDIWIKEGTYISSDLLGYIGKTVNLYGGFPASIDEPTWEDRNWNEYETILDGNGSSRVFLINGGNPIIDGVTITNGFTSSTAGGAIFTGGGTGTMPTFRNCNIKNNICSYNSTQEGWGGGGAIAVYISKPIFINCMITNNSAASAYGGGVWLQSGYADFINCTISKNIALQGGGIYINGETNNIHHAFYNCIIWGNTGTNSSIYRDVRIRYSDDAPDGSNNCSSYYLGDNGVYSDCLFIDPNNDNFHIRPGSPCIDAGTSSGLTLPSTDIDEDARVMDGDENGTATVDIGADELDPNQQFFADIYVDGDNGNNNNDGSDWQKAKKTIQAAIDAANINDEIWVKMGTYTITSEINLNKLVRIYAGFLGTEVQRSARDWKNNTTTITVDAAVSDRCVYISEAAMIDGFKITGANANGKHGAGILASGEGATIINCNITGNKAIHDDPNNKGGSGGGIYCSRTTYIENCEISDNEAATVGGGIYTISSSNTTIRNCTITGNNAVTTFYGGGGGIYNDAGFAPKIIGCTITNNTSGKHGGGIYNNVRNDAEITSCRIILNTSVNNGGGIYSGEASSTSSNYATPKITNCIVANNEAAKGGGVFCEEKSSPEIINCTIAGNKATISNSGGGVYVTYRYSYTKIMNSILYGNTDPGGNSDIYFVYFSVPGSSKNNLVLVYNNFSVLVNSWMNGDPPYKVGNIGVVADFVDYEGPDNDPRIGGDSDYHLTSSSGVIDQGVASYAAFSLTAPSDDLDGMARPQGLGYDMGAYEILIQDSDGDGVLNNIDNCPSIQNPNQEDADNDDIGDACDACMFDFDNDADSDGICGDVDSCPNDPDNDADSDGICGDVDTCPNDPDNDADGDGTCGDVDTCPNDPDNDADGDGICGDIDTCPNDPNNDVDGDGVCGDVDGCPNDPSKTAPGDCGCGIADTDTDSDGTPNCNDGCPDDPAKTTDADSDSDGALDCVDGCPNDPNKTVPGDCGCGIADIDTDGDGTADCADADDDNDGMPDTWEIIYIGLDPLVDDALGDLDNDEYTNLQEYLSGTDPNEVDSVPFEIADVIPHDNAGIDPDDTRIPNNTSFAVLIHSVAGIDINDTTSIKFMIDDDVDDVNNPIYERDLSDAAVVVTKLDPNEPNTAVTDLWAVYHRSQDGAQANVYGYEKKVNIVVDANDIMAVEMVQQSYSFEIETEMEHDIAEASSPDIDPIDPNDPDLVDPDYANPVGIEVTGGDLDGCKIIYDSSEPVQPTLGPTDEVPPFDDTNINAVGVPMNLQPPTVFTTPVKIMIPCPGQADVSILSIYLYNGTEWVLACDTIDVQPGGEGWMVPGSRQNHNGTIPPTIEIKAYHFTGVQAGAAAVRLGSEDDGGCFIRACVQDAAMKISFILIMCLIAATLLAVFRMKRSE